ncbi:uncharacterized protein ATNIH1004_011431 [Aspergillus tanneri]|uniref:O-methyltransferase domain-containing protein n=1 Tax=Aspergillus tanneri TaxID=1220188 RepID=A0A5M9MA05_9EURO|nr:uncharacterized protein ATNIH1004_011431 [Aspergillus tanneri]KAA8642486.1 hypothetical protein ATNIH1004_011431 [Aspergillus tanneri]
MADKEPLADLQQMIATYNKDDPASWTRLDDAMEKVRRVLEPPHVFAMKQRLHTMNNLCIVVALEMGLLQTLATNQGKSLNDMIYPLASRMRQYLRQNKPVNSETTPAYDFAMGETVWQTLAKDIEWKTGFDNNMTARNKTLSVPWHVKYPVKEKLAARPVSTKPVIVDVGGNQGVDLQRFADTFPDLECRLILQDLPETLAGIPGKLDSRIKPTVYDFFTEQTVKGKS